MTFKKKNSVVREIGYNGQFLGYILMPIVISFMNTYHFLVGTNKGVNINT